MSLFYNLKKYLTIKKIIKKITNKKIYTITLADGTIIYNYKDIKKCVIHRDGDLPAIIWADGTKFYYKHDKLHRDNGLPAVELANGNKFYYKHGKLHRDNGLPAGEYSNGIKEYWINGKHIKTEFIKGGIKEMSNIMIEIKNLENLQNLLDEKLHILETKKISLNTLV